MSRERIIGVIGGSQCDASVRAQADYALQLHVPVVSLGSYDVSPEIHKAESPEEAVRMAVDLAGPV